MKKPTKKLALARETVRVLTAESLRGVGGAIDSKDQCNTTSCPKPVPPQWDPNSIVILPLVGMTGMVSGAQSVCNPDRCNPSNPSK